MMHDKNFRLTDYLKYDTQLGRDQNIEIGTTSSLAAQENIHIMGGVTLTCFAPEKRLNNPQKKDRDQDDESFSKAPLSFDQKVKQREKDEREGLLMPR